MMCLFSAAAHAGMTPAEIKEFGDFKIKAESGSAFAQLKLADCYAYGHGVVSDAKLAIELYRQSAEQGNELAQDKLGDCYANGLGADRNDSRAFRWYRRAAEQGLARAQLKAGNCYELGKGTVADAEKAAEWYRAAAAQRNVSAQVALGRCYSKGIGVVRNQAEGYAYFCLASRTSNEARGEFIGLRGGMSLDEISEGIKRAKDLLLDELMATAPRISLNGSTMDSSYSEGLRASMAKGRLGEAFAQTMKWYIDPCLAAARMGDASAQADIGISFALGDGVKPDPVKAHAYLSISGLTDTRTKSALAELEKKTEQEGLNAARELAVQLKKLIESRKAGK
jgi:TPR repeat protein